MASTADVAAFFAWMPVLALGWVWLSSVILSTVVAQSKAQGAVEWAFIALLFGPVALLAVVGMPDRGKKPGSTG